MSTSKILTLQDFAEKKVNMHTHTARCHHATGEDREYVEKAIEAGFDVLGFSDHTPYLFDNGYVSKKVRMTMEELDGYVYSVEKLKKEYQNDIEIHCGLEVEFFPKLFDKTMAIIDQYPLEYMILGQHYFDNEVGNIHVRLPWNEEKDIKLYVDRVFEALETERFLYVAHPDVMVFQGELAIYRKYMTKLAQELKRRNMPVEVNVNALGKGKNYPNPEFVKLAAEIGCHFIIGVDAHKPDDLVDYENYEKCMELAKRFGGEILCR